MADRRRATGRRADCPRCSRTVRVLLGPRTADPAGAGYRIPAHTTRPGWRCLGSGLIVSARFTTREDS